MKIRMKLAAVAILAAAVPAFAQIKINDNLSVTGWTVGSYQYLDTKGTTLTTGGATFTSANSSIDSFNVDAAYLGATVTPTKTVTGTFSFYYKPSGGTALAGDNAGVTPSGSEVTLLDANVAWMPADTVTLTFGKYLSPLGYESFYPISDNMITLANQQFLAPIPGYHEGVKVDYAPDKTTTMGVGLVDSLYGTTPYEGTGRFERSDIGTEGYIQYTGVENLTLWAGFGYAAKVSSAANVTTPFTGFPDSHSVWVLDFWASYQINKDMTVAAEEIYKDGGNVPNAGNAFIPSDKGSNWLAYFQYNFTDKLSSWFSFSGEDVSSATIGGVNFAGPKYWKLSVAPAYAITPNLTVKAQYSYTKYTSYIAKDANFFGVQVGFKF
jgi:hypothetical protein